MRLIGSVSRASMMAAALLGLVIMPGCDQQPNPQTTETEAEPTPTEKPESADQAHDRPPAYYEFTLYTLGEETPSPKDVFDRLTTDGFNITESVKAVKEALKNSGEAQLVWIKGDQQTYPAPDAEMLQYFSRGLTETQAKAVQDCKEINSLLVAAPGEAALPALRRSTELVAKLAEETGSLIWDGETREMFSPEHWRTKRVATWDGDIPRARDQITIHAYDNGGEMRAITLGMAKMALPDLVAEGWTRSTMRGTGNLLNVAAQSLVEHPESLSEQKIEVNLGLLRHSGFVEEWEGSLGDEAQDVVSLAVEMVEPEEGDPNNAIFRLTFAGGEGDTQPERIESVLMALLGFTDQVSMVPSGNDEIAAASALAQQDLIAKIKPIYTKGLSLGERLMIKHGFKTDTDGVEYMWFEVQAWEGEVMRGVLANEPRFIKNLRPGSPVSIKESQAYDYMLYKADGTVVGNETGKVIQKLNAQR